MLKYLRLTKNILLHKWFVFIAGYCCGVSLWRCLIHDLSKFSPAEFVPYAKRFDSGVYDKSAHGEAFEVAWLHHQRNNLHHWQAWVQVENDATVRPLKMPNKYVREMVADWWAAGRGYDGYWRLPKWYRENCDKMYLHPITRAYVENLIELTTDVMTRGCACRMVEYKYGHDLIDDTFEACRTCGRKIEGTRT